MSAIRPSGSIVSDFAVAFACLQLVVTALYFAAARALPSFDGILLPSFVVLQFLGVEVILFIMAARFVSLDKTSWLTAILKGLVLGSIAFAAVAFLSAMVMREFLAVPLGDLANATPPVWLAALLVAPCFGVYFITRGNLLTPSGWEVMFAAGLLYGAILMVESFIYEVALQQAGWSACKPADCTPESLAVYLPLVAVFGAIEALPFAWAYRKLQSRR